MIRFRFTPQYEDYWKFQRVILGRVLLTRRTLFIFGLVIVCSLLMPWVAKSGQPTSGGVPDPYPYRSVLLFDGGIVLYVVVVLAGSRWGAKRNWRTSLALREEREYEFDDEGLCIQGASFTQRIKWNLVLQGELTQGLYLLRVGMKTYHYFPDAALHPEDCPALQDLLRRKVKDFKGLK